MVSNILKKYIADFLGKKRINDNNANAGQENNDDLNLLRNLIDRANDLIEVLDPETGRFHYVNERGCRDLGYSHEELLELSVFDIDPMINPPLLKQITKEISAEDNKIWEGVHLRKDGSTFPVEVNIKMVTIGRKYLVAVARDITARKQEEEGIKNERRLLRTLIDHLPYPIYFKDREARKIIANLADVENIGCANEAGALGKTDIELFEGEIGLRGYTDDQKVLETGLPILNREEMFSDRNTGLQRWLLTSKIPLFDENGNTTGLVGIGRDITYRKKAEEQIQKLTQSVEQSPSSIMITDVNGLIEYVNPQFLEITGYDKEDIIGRNPRILKSGKMPDEVYRQLWGTIVSGKIWRGELVNRKKNGELYWEWVTVTSIKNEAGQITNFIAIKEDISARKQMESDLIIAKEKAEESDRLKSAFLANMSHEIRTPLNSIIGFSKLMQDNDFDDQQKKEFLSHVIDNGNSLLSIISDIMDISRIESGQIELRKTPVSVKEFLSRLIERSKILLGEKKLEFRIDTNSEDCTITTDQERLNQVFNNLISNAVKFTDEGFIRIGYRNEGEVTTFYVKDTGIGIPAEFHEIIFERFRQVETEKKRKHGGNGLGLAITKSLVEMMGGKIWLDSFPGKGSVFYFSIPRNKVSNDNLHDQQSTRST